MRVTQRTMYSNIISYNNRALSALQESNLQSVTEKKVNRPSDDPAGTSNIYNLRASLTSLDNYYTNTQTAKGWLSLADGVLQQVSTMIIDAKTKDLQGATGTVSKENRDQISSQLRQIYEQLIVQGNAAFNGQYIFAGHKTGTPPYERALNAMSYDEELAGLDFEVNGDSTRSIVVQFKEDGEIPPTGPLNYRYSNDGGNTWIDKTMAAGDMELDLDGVIVSMHDTTGVSKDVTAVDPDNPNENDNGTWIWVYPTAKYVGDDEDKVEVNSYSSSAAVASATGSFSRETAVRIDNVAAGVITYSYSTDAGNTWKEGNTSTINGTEARILVPGGYLNLDVTGGNPNLGDQYFIHTRRADIKLDIAQGGESLAINNVGKTVFGGIYQDPDDLYAKAVYDGDGRNLMETIGRLIAFAENGNQEGFQKELAKLEDAHKIILTTEATIGGRLNRAEVAQATIETIGGSETQALSNIEDVDFIELMTKIAQQELVYQSVLKSSSMLMQLSLLNFI